MTNKTTSTTKHNPTRAEKVPFKSRTLAVKLNPQKNTFASISFVLKQEKRKKSENYTLEENEFEFILATALETVHGEIANKPDLLDFKSIDSSNYTAIIRFKTIHYARVVTSLILFGEWKGSDCKFEINKLAQTPFLLTF